MEAMRTACEGARAHILRGPHKQVSLFVFLPLCFVMNKTMLMDFEKEPKPVKEFCIDGEHEVV